MFWVSFGMMFRAQVLQPVKIIAIQFPKQHSIISSMVNVSRAARTPQAVGADRLAPATRPQADRTPDFRPIRALEVLEVFFLGKFRIKVVSHALFMEHGIFIFAIGMKNQKHYTL